MKFVNIPAFADGNNLIVSPLEIGAGQTIRTSNLVPIVRKILQKKPGSVLYKTIADANCIDALKVFYVGSDKYVIAVANFDDNDKIYFSKNGGNFAEMTGATSLGANKNYDIAVMIGKIYFANGTNAIQVSSDGETRANLTGTNIPENPTHIASFKDRLWATTSSNGQHWTHISDDLTPTVYQASLIIKTSNREDPIMGLAPLTFTTATETLTDLMTVIHRDSIYGIEFTTKPIRREHYSGKGGCWDSKSIVNTPLGLMYRSKDTIMLFTGQGEPVAVGDVIRPVWDGSHTFYGASSTYRKACACFFDGFYRIAYPISGSSYNDREYWLDTRYGFETMGWYGDHIGLNIGCYAVDGNDLYAGSSNDGKVWKLNQSTFQDNLTDIPLQLKTRFYTGDGSEYTTKIFKRFGLDISADALINLILRYNINQGQISGLKNLTIPTAGDNLIWGEGMWGVNQWYGGNMWKNYYAFMRSMDRGNFMDFQIDEVSENNVMFRNGLLAFLPTGRIMPTGQE